MKRLTPLSACGSALVAMLLATGLQWQFGFEGVATLGTAFGDIPMSLP